MKTIISLFIFLFCSLSCFFIDGANIVVDRNGRGHFRNIAEAIDSIAKMDSDEIITVYIRDGFYKEKLDIPNTLSNVHFVGESKERTIINYDDHANIDDMRTFKTYTLRVQGNTLLFENITVENTALQLGQAVALHLMGDKLVFKNCRFLGNQDTIYVGEAGDRSLFENCYIEGTTDFIFGPATSWFEGCEIVCKKNSYITAPSTPQDQEFGLIFNNCNIRLKNGVDKVYLGRPWRPYGMTLFMNCKLGKGIVAEGWDNWRNTDNEKTARFMEYNNEGEGANTERRVKWAKTLTDGEVSRYTKNRALYNQ